MDWKRKQARQGRAVRLVLAVAALAVGGIVWRALTVAPTANAASPTTSSAIATCGMPHCGVPRHEGPATMSEATLAKLTPAKRPGFEGCATVTCTWPTNPKTTHAIPKTTCNSASCSRTVGITTAGRDNPFTSSTFGLTNLYNGTEGGKELQVLAGGVRGPSAQASPTARPPIDRGGVIVDYVTSGPYAAPGQFQRYVDQTPSIGALTIVSVTTDIVTLQDSAGAVVTFNLSTDTFTNS